MKTLFFVLIVLLNYGNIIANPYDTLFFINTIKYVENEFNFDFKGNYFSSYKSLRNRNKPSVVLYVSLPFRVEIPKDFYSDSQGLSNEDNEAEFWIAIQTKKGYDTFIYKTYAVSATSLSDTLTSFSKEAISFIIFHELLHIYFIENKYKIPYEFNEAACDIVGNYGTLKYSTENDKLQLDKAKKQIEINEKIYEIINQYTLLINQNNSMNDEFCELLDKCNNEITQQLKYANNFQKNRFGYAVNNAFLVKNSFYSKEYFLLKKVFIKVKTIDNFLDVLNKLTNNSNDCEKYLEKY